MTKRPNLTLLGLQGLKYMYDVKRGKRNLLYLTLGYMTLL